MAKHGLSRGRRARLLDPILVGLFVVGLSFVGVALASQRAPSAIPQPGGSGATHPLPAPWPAVAPSQIAAPSQVGAPTRVSTVAPAGDRATPVAKVLPESLPVSLDIPSIGVTSALHDLGLDESGAIEAPSGARYDEAAWYRHSPMPGSKGPSIILGHVDSAANGPSVFFRLAELVRGDLVSVTRADGSIARFKVDSVRRYPKEDFPTERVYGDLDHAGLRLITCGGAFNSTAGHYEDNIVVFAHLDPSS